MLLDGKDTRQYMSHVIQCVKSI